MVFGKGFLCVVDVGCYIDIVSYGVFVTGRASLKFSSEISHRALSF